MTRREKTLAVVLGAAAILYLLSRTETGRKVTGGIVETLASGVRGIRNNNPGNIRKNSGTTWAGQSTAQTDPAFVQFIAPEYGIRAMARVLKNYFARGVDTLAEVISTWAPASENNTGAYIAAVQKQTGLLPTARLSAADLAKLIPAIIQHENGNQPYSVDIINKGIEMS
jgi:hypothetical protein